MRIQIRWSDNHYLLEDLVFSGGRGDDAVWPVQDIAPQKKIAPQTLWAS